MSTLIVCLPPVSAGPSTNYSYLRLNAGSIEDSQASATAALLPAIGRGSEVVVVVPSAALSWHSIQLPDGVTASSPRLRSILEDVLLNTMYEVPGMGDVAKIVVTESSVIEKTAPLIVMRGSSKAPRQRRAAS